MAAIEKVDFRTPLVKLNDSNAGVAEPLAYPLHLDDLLAEHSTLSIGSFVYASNLLEFHLAPVIVDEKPVGPVVEFGGIVSKEDGYHHTWTVRDLTDAEKAAAFEKDRAERFEQVKSLESTLHERIRTYKYTVDGVEKEFTTSFESNIVVSWTARLLYVSTLSDDTSVYLYPSLSEEVIMPAKEAVRVLNQYFADLALLSNELNRHRYNINRATQETGLPSFPDWIS